MVREHKMSKTIKWSLPPPRLQLPEVPDYSTKPPLHIPGHRILSPPRLFFGGSPQPALHRTTSSGMFNLLHCHPFGLFFYGFFLSPCGVVSDTTHLSRRLDGHGAHVGPRVYRSHRRDTLRYFCCHNRKKTHTHTQNTQSRTRTRGSSAL